MVGNGCMIRGWWLLKVGRLSLGAYVICPWQELLDEPTALICSIIFQGLEFIITLSVLPSR